MERIAESDNEDFENDQLPCLRKEEVCIGFISCNKVMLICKKTMDLPFTLRNVVIAVAKLGKETCSVHSLLKV